MDPLGSRVPVVRYANKMKLKEVQEDKSRDIFCRFCLNFFITIFRLGFFDRARFLGGNWIKKDKIFSIQIKNLIQKGYDTAFV